MERYDYFKAVTDDIKEWIQDNVGPEEELNEELFNRIYNKIFTEEKVTGNGPNGYASEDQCSEYLSNNFYLLYPAMKKHYFLDSTLIIKHYDMQHLARFFDSIIRCDIFDDCLKMAFSELRGDK